MKRQYELTYIPIGPIARVIFFLNIVLGMILGFIIGIFFAAMAKMGLPFNDPNMPEMSPGLMIAVMPIAYAFFGGIAGTLFYVIFTWLYNVIARFTGGIVFEFDSMDDESQRPRPIMQNPPPPSTGPNPLPWSMPSNMSSTIGGSSDAPYRPPTPPNPSGVDESGRQG